MAQDSLMSGPKTFQLAAVGFTLFLWGCGTAPPAGDEEAVSAPVREDVDPRLLAPDLTPETAPEQFSVRFVTTKGPFIATFHRSWAPRGVDRVHHLVTIDFFRDIAFFRAIKDFVIQFGVHGNPEIHQLWSTATFPDDPVKQPNRERTITFATAGPNTRTTQLFINLRDNSSTLDNMGFAPVGEVTDGWQVVESIYTGYGELYPQGKGPRFQLLNLQGNRYLRQHFPEMDYIESAELLPAP